jgi:murein DD-endopeptidase MepM/ murein hydrolase activator NlpD
MNRRQKQAMVACLAILICSCATPTPAANVIVSVITPLAPSPIPAPTSGRPQYSAGELVDYSAQDGDTLPALAAHFNTTEAEIRSANPIIPTDATTMPPGLPMKIPIYYLPLWGTEYKSLPDHVFVNGPSQVGFSTSAFLASTSGWWKDYRAYAGDKMRSGAELVDYVAINYSISPRLLLALLEYQTGALTDPDPPAQKYMLGFRRSFYESPYLQLVIAANTLNNGYYTWRTGELLEIELPDKTLTRPDPWQNAASVAIQYYFSRIYAGTNFYASIGPDGLARTYQTLFGDPWLDSPILIPGSLQQPALRFPFRANYVWSFTGGPHTGWGTGAPFAAIDFAPGSNTSGCYTVAREQFAIAMADGLVVRSSVDGIIVDLDHDGDERTGWVLYYLHLATQGRVQTGMKVNAGDKVGFPSCEGGSSTGTHVHIARKYNGEWIPASGIIPFNLEGWVAQAGANAYAGALVRGPLKVIACECGDANSQIRSEIK